MGVHAIDTARYLLGDPDPQRVCATIGTRYGPYEVDDDGILLISWSNGTNSIVECGWWQPHLAGLEADTELYGTGGYSADLGLHRGPGGLRALRPADVLRADGGVRRRVPGRTPAAARAAVTAPW